jgi:hypothetical protein
MTLCCQPFHHCFISSTARNKTNTEAHSIHLKSFARLQIFLSSILTISTCNGSCMHGDYELMSQLCTMPCSCVDVWLMSSS